MTRLPFSRESLPAIVAGLQDVKRRPIVCEVSCGDVPFTLLETGCEIFPFSASEQDREHFSKRVGYLENYDYDNFLAVPETVREQHGIVRRALEWRNKYFRQGGRLSNIRSMLDNLQSAASDGNFYDAALEVKPFGAHVNLGALLSEQPRKEAFLAIPAGGRLYLSGQLHPEIAKVGFNQVFQVDREATRVARKHHRANDHMFAGVNSPTVYKRMPQRTDV